MQNLLCKKSIFAAISALFFIAGIGGFALRALAAGETWASSGNPYPYVLKTIPEALTPRNKTDYENLPDGDYYKGRVRGAVSKYFGTGGLGEATIAEAIVGRDAWNKAKRGYDLWKAYVDSGSAYVPPNKQTCSSYDGLDCVSWMQPLTTYTSLADATAAEENWRIYLNAADTAYINELNDTTRDAIAEQVARIEFDKNRDALALAEQTLRDCIAAAGEDQGKKDLCDLEKKARDEQIAKTVGEPVLGAVGAAGTSAVEGAEISKALTQAGLGGGLVGPPPPQAGQLTQDDRDLASKKEINLTADQKAKALALSANQETSSPKEDELMKSIKEACAKDWFFSMNCLAEVPYYFIYRPASWLMIIAGYMFDASLTLSINKNFVNQPFVTESWTVIRDFSNMLFIFILLYTGIMTIFGQTEWRKTVIHIIIIALLINFSLFFTKVVIDAGNILAVGIFQSMGAQKDAKTSIIKTAMGSDVPERDLSASLVANFRPQQFLAKAGATDTWNTIIVFIIAAVVNVAVAYVLFKVALLFIGRLLAFWVLMILSPFALISFTLKGKANIFGWWTETLIGQAFVAPVFLFLLYLIMTVISAGENGIMGAFSK